MIDGSFLRGFDANASVDDLTTLTGEKRENRVEVDFGDLWGLFNQERDPQQDLLKGGYICRLMSSVPFQQAESTDLADHLTGIAVGQRGHTEAHVSQDFDMHPAEAESDQ